MSKYVEAAKRIEQFYEKDEMRLDAPMSDHTSFKIGGPAKILTQPRQPEQIRETLNVCRDLNLPFYIIGNGSNLLVPDHGIDGVVVKISDAFDDARIEGTKIIAKSGILLSRLANLAMNNDLGGLEFASGIPGTLGGAIFMNAGAYGGEMKDVVESVTILTQEGEIVTLENEACEFGYRSSAIQRCGSIVLEVTLNLESRSYADIKEVVDDLTVKRTSKQPLDLPSAGSTFKRPEGHYAGKLIDDAGLRGIRVGDAQVSEKHCGFVVNRGKATSAEVMELISLVQKVVKDKFDVTLEPEVRLFGEE